MHFHLHLGIDSIGFVELRSQVERRFDITISDEDFTPENFVSIERLAAYLDRVTAAAPTTP
jgi:acyl carrier protein